MNRDPLVIVGLGNPGDNYAKTRHNLGWRVVEAFADKYGLTFKEEARFKAHVAKGTIKEHQLYLILPKTYMNESGQAVAGLLNFYKIPPSHIVVAVDDVALPFGQMRFRTVGSAGGHNGLKSIETHLGTRDYMRLRLGIDQKLPQQELSSYVLDRFTAQEMEQLPAYEQRAVIALERLLSQEPEQVMNQINPKLEQQDDNKKAEEKPL